MAIYNPKRARELEAAARLAESQRQRELAKGQREQRTTEQILGLVEGLIGAAPQAAQAFEQSQAERVLAGERPLEMEAAKDPFTSLGRLLFEPGIKAKAQKMAQEQKAQRLQAAEPLLREAIKAPRVKTPAKFKGEPEVLGAPYADFGAVREPGVPYAIEPEVKFTPREAGMQQLMRDPALALLPEREREAALAGLEQRMGAEQAAAERQRKIDEAKLTEMAADASLKSAKAAGLKIKEEDKKKIAQLTPAVQSAAQKLVLERKEPLTSTDGEIQIEALNEIQSALDENLRAMGEDPYSAASQAVKLEAINKAREGIDMKPLNAGEVEKLVTQGETLRELVQLDALRRKANWNPERAEIIRQKIAEELESPISLIRPENLLKLAVDLETRLKLSADERAFLNKANILRNRAALAEFAGTGAVGEKEANRVLPFVLNPWTTDVEWEKDFSITLQSAASRYGQHVRALRATNTFDENIVNLGKMAIQYGTSDTQEESIERSLKQAKEEIESPAETVRPDQQTLEKELKEYTRGALGPAARVYGSALGLSPQDFEEYAKKFPRLSEALGVVDEFFAVEAQQQSQQQPAAPQTSQQQMQQTQPMVPLPQKPSDAEPEVEYLRLRQQGLIDPAAQKMLIINTDKGTFYQVVDSKDVEGFQKMVLENDPNVGIQIYTGNLAGGQ